jgi:hypothetical protein
MATVSKNFRVKNGLVVEGTTATVNGHNILTANNSTDDVTEGSSNLFFTEERAQEAVNSLISAGTHGNITIDYDDENNSLSFTVDQGLIPDTDSLPEGVVNEYFTDERAQDAVALAIAAGTHENIGITYADGALSFAAENGVADSDTDDLDEGETNLYFTNQRALDATSAAYDVVGSGSGALTQANDYTDGEITTALTTAQGYADTAEADAISTAAADATSKANAAQAAAEATASLDATTKANAAQAAAEATASADATTKANDAQSDAETYADTLIGDVTVDGTGGNTVTDRIASAVADLVDASPAALDTLNELAAALGDDPNFATTVATDIGTKVSKSGDSMTGDLTLAADPTSNFHAATKQYVDAAESAAETAAASYTDGEISSLETSLELYADQVELDAVSTANTYTDGRETAITTAYQSYADTAEADAISTAAADATSKANAAQAAAEATASADATTKANAAQAAAEATASADATSKANTAQSNAETFATTAINALDTDDIEEGTSNKYFTDARSKTAAAELLTGATLQNITITGNGSGLTITAENGVADSDTDDLDEGASNLYFTDQRAVDALQAVTPVFEEIDVNSIALNVASSVTVTTQNTTGTVYSFDSGTYTSAKFLVKSDTGTHTEVMEVLVTLDGSSNIAITEYAIVNTGGSLADITAVMNGTDVELQATVVNDNTVVRAYGTLIV